LRPAFQLRIVRSVTPKKMTPQMIAASTVVAANFCQMRGFRGALGAFPGTGLSSGRLPQGSTMNSEIHHTTK
jgi:hypothetical protein